VPARLVKRVRGRPHLPSQVTSTRISPCANFRWLFFKPSLKVIVLVIRRQLAAEEAVTRVFSRVAALERERCFFILYAETLSKRFTFNNIYQRSVPWRTAKKIAAFGRRRRAEHGRTTPARALAMELEVLTLARRALGCSSSHAIASLHAAPSGPQP